MRKVFKSFLTSILACYLCLIPISAHDLVHQTHDSKEITPRSDYDFVKNITSTFKYDGDWYTVNYKVNVTQDMAGNILNVYNVHEVHSTLPDDYYASIEIISHSVLHYYEWRVSIKIKTMYLIFEDESYATYFDVSSAGPM